MSLTVVGSIAFDAVETPTGKRDRLLGGAAVHFSLASSFLAETRVVGPVGDDFGPDEYAVLHDRGVITDDIEHVPGGKTFFWAGRYERDPNVRHTLQTDLNVFADFRPKLPQSFVDSPFVLLGNIQPQLQLDVLAQIKAPRFVAADTMNFWISGERKKLGEVLAKIDTLMINDEELRQLADIHNIRRAAAEVLKLGPKRLIMKRGEYGAMLFDKDGVFFTPAYPLEEEIDPTGAGDSFAGALLGYLAAAGTIDGPTLRRGLRLASAVASFCVEGVGAAKLKNVHRADVMMRLEALRSITKTGG